MNHKSFGVIAIVFAGAAFLLLNSFFVLEQTKAALVTEFGRPVKVEQDPGLKFKIPFIQTVEYFDRRILEYKMPVLREINSLDQKRVVISAFMKWRVVDPLKFAQTTRTGGFGADREAIMNDRLATILESSLRQVLGNYPLSAVLSPKRSQIMREIRDLVNLQAASQKVLNDQAKADAAQAVKDGGDASKSAAIKAEENEGFGIEIVDVKILRADLPQENSNAIFKRMQTERDREAKDFRAKGEEEAQRIKSKADRDRTIILAEAQKKAETLRGEGDGEASRISANAYSKDPSFYEFYRSMQAYTRSLDKNDTTMVLSPNSRFLKQMDSQ